MKKLLIITIAMFISTNALAAKKTIIDPDGAYVITALAPIENDLVIGAFDGKVRILDVSSSKEKFSLIGHSKPVKCVSIDKTGKYILSGGADGKLIIWDRLSGTKISEQQKQAVSFNDCLITPDSKYVIAAYASVISIWDRETWENIAIIEGVKQGANSLAISSDGKITAVGGKGGHIGLYSVPSGKLTNELNSGRDLVASLAFSPDSMFLISGGYDNIVRIWDIQNVKILKEYSNHIDTVRAVAAAFNNIFASAGDDGLIYIYDLSKDKFDKYDAGGSVSAGVIALDPYLRFISAAKGAAFESDRYLWINLLKSANKARKIHFFMDAIVVEASEGYISGNGSYPNHIKVIVGGNEQPFSDFMKEYDRPNSMKVDIGNKK